MALGGRNADEPYVTCARIFSAIYFLFFFAISRFTTVLLNTILFCNKKAQKFGHRIFKQLFPNVQFHSTEFLERKGYFKRLRREPWKLRSKVRKILRIPVIPSVKSPFLQRIHKLKNYLRK